MMLQRQIIVGTIFASNQGLALQWDHIVYCLSALWLLIVIQYWLVQYWLVV